MTYHLLCSQLASGTALHSQKSTSLARPFLGAHPAVIKMGLVAGVVRFEDDAHGPIKPERMMSPVATRV